MAIGGHEFNCEMAGMCRLYGQSSTMLILADATRRWFLLKMLSPTLFARKTINKKC
jgi:hypothetical protein